MKPSNYNEKLQLKRQAVSNLTKTQLKTVKGGAKFTKLPTLNNGATLVICCEPQPTTTITFCSTLDMPELH